MATIFEPMRQRVLDWGWRRALYWQFMHGLKRIIGLHLHYVRVGSDRDDLLEPDPPHIDTCFDCRLGTIEDLQPFVGKPEHLDQEFLDDFVARNDQCVIILHKDELVHFTFYSRSRTRVTPQLDVIIPQGFRYSYKAWTHEDFRLRNLAKYSTWYFQSNGYRPHKERSLSYIETHNYASLLRSPRHPNKQSIKVGYIGWIVIGGRQIPFTSRRARWIGFVLMRRNDHRVRQSII